MHKTAEQQFDEWFATRGWRMRDHQRACLDADRKGLSYLLIAPTGGGKTLAGFLPSLFDLVDQKLTPKRRPHTLYVSPLKALSVDIARNLKTPINEMGLSITVETRTGDTPAARRQRQKYSPPDILLTTPESLSLLIADEQAKTYFGGLQRIVLDELHALAPNKRGELLSLALARLRQLAPQVRLVGLSATVAEPENLIDYLTPQNDPTAQRALLIEAPRGAPPRIDILVSEQRVPWSGHSGRHAYEEVYRAIQSTNLSLIFVNTRSQAEVTFSALWRINEGDLPIALHHGSLEVEQRRRVETAMAAGKLRAVVCTSTLDLGIDWGDVDLVIQMGAPKGVSRLTQRIGRANHRMNEPSRALLVPANRMEYLECVAAKEAIDEGDLDGASARQGSLDVLAQHILGVAVCAPFHPDALFQEIKSAAPYAALTRKDFDDAVEFVASGGYSLKAYDRFRRIVKTTNGEYRIRDKKAALQYRMNVGTIVEAPVMNVRLVSSRGGMRPGRKLGTLEEWFFDSLRPGETFYFAGEVLQLQGVSGEDALVTRAVSDNPRIPTWGGAKFAWSTYLANRVREMVHDPAHWQRYPEQVRDWLEKQREVAAVPAPDRLMVETFPYQDRFFMVAYAFDGWSAHQTLGMLMTRRLERAGFQPLGFAPTEYALSVWGRKDMRNADMAALFHEDMLGDDLESWLAESVLMKRTFRNCAMISGLIERQYPGQRKSGRQISFSADLIYDVLREHQPDHLLMRAAWSDAAGGYLDIERLQGLLTRIAGRVDHSDLDRVSPLAVPVMLEIGRESVAGTATEAMLQSISDKVIAEAMGADYDGGDEKTGR